MAIETRHWTRADLERLPEDGRRYEVLDGELLVTPLAGRPHQRIAFKLTLQLGNYLLAHKIGEGNAPGAVPFGKNELQPDLLVIADHGPPTADDKWDEANPPILVVEILSRSTQGRDLGIKRAAYQRLGIPTYWIVDRFRQQVLVYSAGKVEPEAVTDVLRWQPRADLPAFEIAIASIFP